MSDLNSPLDFYKSEKEAQSGGLHRIVKQMAFLNYLGVSLKSIHKYAAAQGYKGTYSSFTSWLRRNVDFDAECRKHESEFKAADPRPPLRDFEDLNDSGGTSESSNESNSNEMFAPRIPPEKATQSTGSREAEPSVSEPPKEAERKPSPRDALEKWQSPSYEDQLKKLGLAKGKHDDPNKR